MFFLKKEVLPQRGEGRREYKDYFLLFNHRGKGGKH
jgi:hypothetical protein